MATGGTKTNVLDPAETGEEAFATRGAVESLTGRDFPPCLLHMSGNPQSYFKGIDYLM